MGDLEAVLDAKPQHPARKEVQAFMGTELFALAEEELIPEADSQERALLTHRVTNGLDQLKPPQVLHTRAEGADAGKDHAASGVDSRRAGAPGALRFLAGLE